MYNKIKGKKGEGKMNVSQGARSIKKGKDDSMNIKEFNEKYEVSILQETLVNHIPLEVDGEIKLVKDKSNPPVNFHDIDVGVYDKVTGEEVLLQGIGVFEDIPLILKKEFGLKISKEEENLGD